MDGWEKFDGTSVPVKEDFYSSLNMERHILMMQTTIMQKEFGKRVE